MAQTSSRSRRGKSSRKGRGLKITLGLLLALLLVIVLNAFALNNETEPASGTTTGSTLVDTTSGQLEVVKSGPTQPAPESDAPSPLPVVLIHGSGGAINWWDEITPLLNTDREVIAIDLLGYGGSNKPKDGYSVESQAGLVAQVLTELDVDSAVIVGHSFGGKVTTALAESSPELVAGAVLIDIGPDSSFGGLSGGAEAAQWPLLGQAMWRISPDFMVRRNIAQGFAPGFEVPDKYIEDVRQMTYPSYTKSFSASQDYTDSEPLNDRIEKTGVPLLVIFGEEDQIYDSREALSAYAAIPGVQTLLIPGAGHSPQVEAPAETAAAIKQFANSLAPDPEPAPEPKPKPNKKKQQQNGQKQKSGNASKKKTQQQKKKQANQKQQANQKKQSQQSGQGQ